MRQGAARREKKPARCQRHELVGAQWCSQASLGQNGGAEETARVLMPRVHCTFRASRNLRSTTRGLSCAPKIADVGGQALPVSAAAVSVQAAYLSVCRCERAICRVATRPQ